MNNIIGSKDNDKKIKNFYGFKKGLSLSAQLYHPLDCLNAENTVKRKNFTCSNASYEYLREPFRIFK